jgi:vacuolar-type H+-ATPase subunit H
MSEQRSDVLNPRAGGSSGGERPPQGDTGSTPSAVDKAQERASNVVHEAQEQTRGMIDEARSQVRSQAQTQTGRASDVTRDLSRELRSMADSNQGGHLTSIAREGATQLERLSSRLDQGGVDGLVGDVKRFARRRPGVFLASCAGAGFLIGRLLHNTDTDALREAVQHEESGHAGNGHQRSGPSDRPSTSSPSTRPTGPTSTSHTAGPTSGGGVGTGMTGQQPGVDPL